MSWVEYINSICSNLRHEDDLPTFSCGKQKYDALALCLHVSCTLSLVRRAAATACERQTAPPDYIDIFAKSASQLNQIYLQLIRQQVVGKVCLPVLGCSSGLMPVFLWADSTALACQFRASYKDSGRTRTWLLLCWFAHRQTHSALPFDGLCCDLQGTRTSVFAPRNNIAKNAQLDDKIHSYKGNNSIYLMNLIL